MEHNELTYSGTQCIHSKNGNGLTNGGLTQEDMDRRLKHLQHFTRAEVFYGGVAKTKKVSFGGTPWKLSVPVTWIGFVFVKG